MGDRPADKPRITIELVEPDGAADDRLVERLADIVNAAYAETEGTLWRRQDHRRTEPHEVAAMIARRAIAVARVSGQVAGCVRIETIDDDTAGFGLLAAASDHRGAGVGRRLVAFVEQLARSRGAKTIECLLLVPREGTHPFKVRLDAWYRRLGYQVVGRRTVEEIDPPSEPLLAVPCWFVTYRKPLAADET